MFVKLGTVVMSSLSRHAATGHSRVMPLYSKVVSSSSLVVTCSLHSIFMICGGNTKSRQERCCTDKTCMHHIVSASSPDASQAHVYVRWSIFHVPWRSKVTDPRGQGRVAKAKCLSEKGKPCQKGVL